MASEERTEQPTPRRRRQARDEGRVATSVDLSRALALPAIYLAWRACGREAVAALSGGVERWLRAAGTTTLDAPAVMDLYADALGVLARALAPVMLAAVGASVLVSAAQTRGLLSAAALRPDLNRINPAAGARRLLGRRGAAATVKGVVKVGLLLAIAGWVLHARAEVVVATGAMDLGPMLATVLGIAAELIVKCALVLVVLGAADYAFEWWEHEKSLRMTRAELRRDLREDDGDPQIRRRRQQLRRTVLAQGISAELPQADVVVTNPTHFAVALRYDPRRMSAPRVVARGQRAIAREIIRLARVHGIEVIQNPPVARSLFAACALGEPVPQELYQVIAEIFALVYRRRRERAQARRRPLRR